VRANGTNAGYLFSFSKPNGDLELFFLAPDEFNLDIHILESSGKLSSWPLHIDDTRFHFIVHILGDCVWSFLIQSFASRSSPTK